MQGNHPKNKSQSPLQCHPASLTHAVLHPSPLCCSLACCFPFKLPRASQGPSCCVHTALYLLSLRTEGPATPQKTATLTIVFNAHSRLRIFFFKALITTNTLLFDHLQTKEIFSKAGILFWPCSIQTHRVQGWHTTGISSILFPFQKQYDICFHSLSKNNNKKGDL